MATQGLVSVLKNKKVVLKIICGSNGYNAQRLAKALRSSVFNKTPSLHDVYELAVSCDFGSVESLVVMDKHSFIFKGENTLSKRYRKTFPNPTFNPRWKRGTADHIEIVYF